MKILVKSFGEKGSDQWYMTADNNRHQCGEKEIDMFWYRWIRGLGFRNDDDTYVIFEFNEPQEFSIKNK